MLASLSLPSFMDNFDSELERIADEDLARQLRAAVEQLPSIQHRAARVFDEQVAVSLQRPPLRLGDAALATDESAGRIVGYVKVQRQTARLSETNRW